MQRDSLYLDPGVSGRLFRRPCFVFQYRFERLQQAIERNRLGKHGSFDASQECLVEGVVGIGRNENETPQQLGPRATDFYVKQVARQLRHAQVAENRVHVAIQDQL